MKYQLPVFMFALGFACAMDIQPKPAKAFLNPCSDPCTVQTRVEKRVKNTTVLYQGGASYYSHDGCLGCHPRQIMGNGQPFNENAMTLAIPCEDIVSKKHRYNTRVRVVNVKSGRSVEATITDCGGFSKYNRVADLSKGLAETLKVKTDKTQIRIEAL